MTKEDKIKESWAELGINASQSTYDNDGWCYSYFCGDIEDNYGSKTIDFDFEVGKFRPKTLQGIEDNNGWIVLESVDDLPKTVAFYWAEDREGNIGQVHFENLTTANYVAYQPFVKPKERLY